MEDKNKLPEGFEALSKAITKAIMQSQEVRRAIFRILRENSSLKNSLLVMVMKLETMKDASVRETQNTKQSASRPGKARAQMQIPQEELFLDGEKLSPNALAFLEYCSKIFNEEKWLKDHKITFSEEDNDQ